MVGADFHHCQAKVIKANPIMTNSETVRSVIILRFQEYCTSCLPHDSEKGSNIPVRVIVTTRCLMSWTKKVPDSFEEIDVCTWLSIIQNKRNGLPNLRRRMKGRIVFSRSMLKISRFTVWFP